MCVCVNYAPVATRRTKGLENETRQTKYDRVHTHTHPPLFQHSSDEDMRRNELIVFLSFSFFSFRLFYGRQQLDVV